MPVLDQKFHRRVIKLIKSLPADLRAAMEGDKAFAELTPEQQDLFKDKVLKAFSPDEVNQVSLLMKATSKK